MKLLQNNMTYRDLKNFYNIMRWIGYSRPIFVENSKLLYSFFFEKSKLFEILIYLFIIINSLVIKIKDKFK